MSHKTNQLEITPGPWVVRSEYVVAGNYAVADCAPDYCSAFRCIEDTQKWQANARAIAALPDVLEALARVVAETTCVCIENGPLETAGLCLHCAASAALEKACPTIKTVDAIN